MNVDPYLPLLVKVTFFVLIVGIILRFLNQPYVVAYLLAGMLMGEHGFALITDQSSVMRLGAFGVVLLMFFIGLEMSLPRLLNNWRVALIGNAVQILLSVVIVVVIGWFFDWPFRRSLLLGFVISESCTALVIKILQDRKEIESKLGQDVVAFLLVQDLAVIPMLIVLSFFGSDPINPGRISMQIIGGMLIIGSMIALIRVGRIKLPFRKLISQDHELQVFTAMIICFGLALITNLLGLSSALGAFLAGIVVSTAKETSWVYNSLNSFRVVFIAMFFVSIGMLVDLNFLADNLLVISLLTIAAFLTNTLINAVTLKYLGSSWSDSLYAGALLSQIGEFSFILAAIGFQTQIIGLFGYQTTITIIAMTLLLSPLWISVIKRWALPKPASEISAD